MLVALCRNIVRSMLGLRDSLLPMPTCTDAQMCMAEARHPYCVQHESGTPLPGPSALFSLPCHANADVHDVDTKSLRRLVEDMRRRGWRMQVRFSFIVFIYFRFALPLNRSASCSVLGSLWGHSSDACEYGGWCRT